jgi:hypothetical protein
MKHFYRLTVCTPLFIHLLAGLAAAAAIPQEAINRATERGVAALRKMQADDGSFSGTSYGSGPTSLAALALLECGVNTDDEQVRKAVAYVRRDSPAMNRTYSLALAIMLLDRFGDPRDEPVIHVLAVRLIEGQTGIGGWGYECGPVSADESTKLRALIEGRELKTTPSGPDEPSRRPIDPELIDRLKRLEQRRSTDRRDAQFDNSNTQFAILGAWVARRHGIPTDAALKTAERYFRATQVGGRWPYVPSLQVEDRPANTCAGLLGLAIGAGIVRETQLRTNAEHKDGKPPALHDALKDPLVQVAMNFVGAQVAQTAAAGVEADLMTTRNYYFLWSAERVGVIFSVKLMGGVDWYQHGAAAILRAQQADGSWPARTAGIPTNGSDINTCFALLFLRKSNFANDLTANLRVKPKQTTIRSGDDKVDDVVLATEPTEVEQLTRELPGATQDRQDAIVVALRDGKGAEFTDALSRAIPTLAGAIQKKARDALAERLAHMNAATVRNKLKDDHAEVRRAAALACAMKDDKSFVPDLIAALDDKDAWVVRSAAVALRTLTGQDFGPAATATADERSKAVAAWKAWWKRQNAR